MGARQFRNTIVLTSNLGDARAERACQIVVPCENIIPCRG